MEEQEIHCSLCDMLCDPFLGLVYFSVKSTLRSFFNFFLFLTRVVVIMPLADPHPPNASSFTESGSTLCQAEINQESREARE